MKLFPPWYAALIACSACLPALASVTATLNNHRIALGQTVQLVVQSDTIVDGQPDIAPLARDFKLLGSSSGSSTQIINGKRSSQVQITLILAPKREGVIQIPALRWGAEQSAPVELIVSADANPSAQGDNTQAANAQGSAEAAAPVFLTATAEHSQAYVQQAVLLSVRLYVGAQISQATLDLQGNTDVLVKPLGKDVQTNETRSGRNYQVIERKYILLPQRSGRISLPGPVFDAQVQDTSGRDTLDSFFNRPFGAFLAARPVHLVAKTIELNVLPRPPNATGANWLPAKNLTLEESWKPDVASVRVGEPLTRHLRLSAKGLTGAQLPELSSLMSVPDGIKMYPDQARTEDGASGDTIAGSRDQDIALIASAPGTYTLPAIKLFWWDTAANLERSAQLPVRTLTVLPATGSTGAAAISAPRAALAPGTDATPAAMPVGAPARAAESASVLLWQSVSAVLALLWLGTALAWWYRGKRRNQTTPAQHERAAHTTTAAKTVPLTLHASTALRALQQACRDNDPHAARKHVLDWACESSPQAHAGGLNALAQHLGEPACTNALRELDRACFAGGAWQGAALAKAFAAPPRQRSPRTSQPSIPALYT